MLNKRIPCPERLRRIPKQFSWVDHRLVRDRHICGLSHEAHSLYLFLVTVSDADGVSYYSDVTVGKLLSMEPAHVDDSRRALCRAGLLAYCRPFYQVLSLERGAIRLEPVLCDDPQPAARGGNEMVSIGQVLRQVFGGAS